MLTYSVDEYLEWIDTVDVENEKNYCWWKNYGNGIYETDCYGFVTDINPVRIDHPFIYCPFCGNEIKVSVE